MIVGLVLSFIVIFLLQVPKLIKKRLWKELVIYLVLFSLGVLYSFGEIYDWKLPNPTTKMEYIFEPTWEKIEKILS